MEIKVGVWVVVIASIAGLVACGGETITGGEQTNPRITFDVTLRHNHDFERWRPAAEMVLSPNGSYTIGVVEWLSDGCTTNNGVTICHSGWRDVYEQAGTYTYNPATSILLVGVLPIAFHPPHHMLNWNFGPGLGIMTLTVR